MIPVESIATEDEPDLVVSFVLEHATGQALTLLRSPQYEAALPAHERGISVSTPDPADQERDLLQRLVWQGATVTVGTERHEYRLDVSAVDEEEAAEARAVLRKMATGGVAYVEVG